MKPCPDLRLALASGLLLLAACQSKPPLPIMPRVDVARFMGPWYVIACTPTWMDRGAYSAIESYERAPDGRILTTFTFRKDGFDGPLKTLKPVGFVKEEGQGAIWGMRFVWPIQADYRVMYVDPEYRITVVGRQKRDYAWIMARVPVVSEAEYAHMIELLKAAGYDTSTLRRVPQRAADGEHPG
jgi:apolipoprotein D and lipocalin family protein